ncbi:MAG: hypothetical protein GY769_04375 [bacterium]|nr:hypothetical protein [bacterium]
MQAGDVQQIANQPIVVGGLLAVLYAMVRVVEVLAARRNGKNGKPGSFVEEDRQKLITLYKQHQLVDEDGTPLWYLPRSMIRLQTETNSLLKKLNTTMENFECPYGQNGEEED